MNKSKIIVGLLFLTTFYFGRCDGDQPDQNCGSPEVSAEVLVLKPNFSPGFDTFVDIEVVDNMDGCSQTYRLENSPYVISEHDIKIPTNHPYTIKASVWYYGSGFNRFVATGEQVYGAGVANNLNVIVVAPFVQGYAGDASAGIYGPINSIH